jgi:hypothetical protein
MKPDRHTDHQKTPSPIQWNEDFQTLLSIHGKASDAKSESMEMIYSRYPDSGFAHEYWFSIWNASCYLNRNSKSFEELNLVVTGDNCIVKDELISALYHPFLECPLEIMHEFNPSPKQIADKASEIRKIIENQSGDGQ